MSASPALQMGLFGGNDPAPYITLDDVDYPLVPGSIVEGAPLNPFSPSNADGNSVAVVSQRHASEVWDDFTGGLGWRDDEPGSHKYALGNLDARVPGGLTLPHKASQYASGVGTLTSYVVTAPGNFAPVRAEYTGDVAGWAFLTWKWSSQSLAGFLRRITATGVSTVGVPDTDDVKGLAQWKGNWYVVVNSGGNIKLYKSSGTSQTMAFATTGAPVAGVAASLVTYDDKLIIYNASTKSFQQWDEGTLTWVAFLPGFVVNNGAGEGVRQLFVWTDKSGSRDALYALTEWRAMVYDEDGQQWESLYTHGDLFWPYEAMAHVNRRDNSLLVTTSTSLALAVAQTTPTGTLLLFNPGTVDNIPINKGYAFPNNATYNGLGSVAPVNHMAVLSSGIHWLYAWCYAPTGLGAGIQGGVFAYNEFGGWTQVFDPVVVSGGTTKSVIGGGYGAGYLLTVLTDGSYYVQAEFDANFLPPFGVYDDQAAGSSHTYFLRSGRVFNKQRNIKKLGSHVEVTFQGPIPTGGIVGKGTAYLRWRFFNENGLSAWQQSALFTSGAQRVSVDLTDGSGTGNGIQYYYMEWELDMYMPTSVGTPPVVESVVLYYTYFQTNKYAYSMNVDLTAETWDEFYPDGTFHGKTRAYLQTSLLALMDQTKYHSFTYSQLFFTETVTRADLSLARRESSDDASGVYGLTVRDLEADAPTGLFYAG